MSGAEVIIAVVVVPGGISFIYAARNSISKQLTGRFKQYLKRKKLRKSIENLDYNEFKNIIYEIKTLDIKYEMNGYNDVKKQFFFSDNIMENKNIFLMKYDNNYDFENRINTYIDNQIERSMSRKYGLDL